MTESPSGRTVKSVLTAIELVEHIRDVGEATVTDLAEQMDVTPGTVHTHLTTLKNEGLVLQQEHQYTLGPQFLAYGEHVRNHSDLYQASKEQIDNLANKSSESAHLIIEHDAKLFVLYERFGSEAVGVELHDWKREEPLEHLHCTAAGKAILAHTDRERVEQLVNDGYLRENTQNTITDVDQLFEELDRIRQCGYAKGDEEQVRGIRAVGAPILDTEDHIKGALAVSGPTSRLRNEYFNNDLPEMVLEAANICEVNLQRTDFENGFM